jgi:hypothetical protein
MKGMTTICIDGIVFFQNGGVYLGSEAEHADARTLHGAVQKAFKLNDDWELTDACGSGVGELGQLGDVTLEEYLSIRTQILRSNDKAPKPKAPARKRREKSHNSAKGARE